MKNDILSNPEKERKLELSIEDKCILLLKDLEQIRDSSNVLATNYDFMEEALRNLINAEYHIVTALTYCKGINAKKNEKTTAEIVNSVMDYLKKYK
jgi:hypothetical protein